MSVEVVGPALAEDDAADVAHPFLGREPAGLQPGFHLVRGDELALVAELGGRLLDGLLGALLLDGIEMGLTGEALPGPGLELLPAATGLGVQHDIPPMENLAVDGEEGAIGQDVHGSRGEGLWTQYALQNGTA